MKDNHYNIIKNIGESVTGKEPASEVGRTGFIELLDLIRQHSQPGNPVVVLCYSVDRLGRNDIDAGSIAYLVNKRRVIIKTVRDGEITRTNSLMINVHFMMAAKYSRDLEDYAVRSARSKIDSNTANIYAPMGYRNTVEKKQGERIVVPDGTEIYDPIDGVTRTRFELVKIMFDKYLTGQYSCQSLAMEMSQRGLKSRITNRDLGHSTVRNILTNPFYYGMFRYSSKEHTTEINGELHQGSHPPMITYEQHLKVLALLGIKNKPGILSKNHAYTNLFHCVCGGSITCDKKVQIRCANKRCKNNRNKYNFEKYGYICPKCGHNNQSQPVLDYSYYFCSQIRDHKCHQPKITGKQIDEQVNNF